MAKLEFETGAVRSDDDAGFRFDLIFKSKGLLKLAAAFDEGSKKYTDNNWMKGIPISNLLNHALRHIYLYQQGDRTEDHLGHACWNLLTAAHFDCKTIEGEIKTELNLSDEFTKETTQEGENVFSQSNP